MGVITERYSPVVVGVNATVKSNSVNALGGFLCVTTGTLTLSSNGEFTVGNGQTIFTAFPVTAGNFYKLPFRVAGGYTLVAAGGASGVLGVV